MRSSSGGWQGHMLLWLQRQGNRVVDAVDWMPGWLIGVSLAAVVFTLARTALRQIGWLEHSPTNDPSTEMEQTVEHQDDISRHVP